MSFGRTMRPRPFGVEPAPSCLLSRHLRSRIDLGPTMWHKCHPPKASRSEMVSVSSSCRVVALGDADPLECYRLHSDILSLVKSNQDLCRPIRVVLIVLWVNRWGLALSSGRGRGVRRLPVGVAPFHYVLIKLSHSPVMYLISLHNACAVSRGGPARNGAWRPPAIVGRTGRR